MRDVEFGADEREVVVEADSGDQRIVVGGDEQGECLGESFAGDLVERVHGQDAQPRHVLGRASGRVAGALQGVAEDLVQGELAGADVGEAGPAGVDAQADASAGAVEPVPPVVVGVHGLDGEVVGGGRAGDLAHGGFQFGGGVADGLRGVGDVDDAFGL